MINFKKLVSGELREYKGDITLNTIVVKNKDIDDTEINGESVMMNFDKGEYFMLNDVGSRIWNLIDTEIEVEKIVSILIDKYEVDCNKCEKSVINFLGKLKHAELIGIK